MPRPKAQPQRVAPVTPLQRQPTPNASSPEGAAPGPWTTAEVTAAAAQATNATTTSSHAFVYQSVQPLRGGAGAMASADSPQRGGETTSTLVEARRRATDNSQIVAAQRAAAEAKRKAEEGRRTTTRARPEKRTAADQPGNEADQPAGSSTTSTKPAAPPAKRPKVAAIGAVSLPAPASSSRKGASATAAAAAATQKTHSTKTTTKKKGKRARSPSPPRPSKSASTAAASTAAAASSKKGKSRPPSSSSSSSSSSAKKSKRARSSSPSPSPAPASAAPAAIPSSSSMGDPQWEVDQLLAKRVRLETRRALKKMRAWDASGLSAEELCERDLGELVDFEEEDQQLRRGIAGSAVAAAAASSVVPSLGVVSSPSPSSLVSPLPALYTLIDSKVQLPLVEYRIRWKGYTQADDSWEPRWNIHHLPIEEFEAAQVDKRKALWTQVVGGHHGAEEELRNLIQHPKLTDLDPATLRALREKDPAIDALLTQMRKGAFRKKRT